MKLLFEIVKEFKGLLIFAVMTAYAFGFWHIGAKELAVTFGGGALAYMTPYSQKKPDDPPK